MATEDPPYFQCVPLSREIQQKEILLHLYMFQNASRQHGNQKVILDPNPGVCFGCTVVIDWSIRDGPGHNAKVVAQAQGLHLGASMRGMNWFVCFNIVFTDKRFSASSLKVLGSFEDRVDGEWAIIGGTGEFAFAQGVVKYKSTDSGGAMRELRIRALCLTFPEPTPVTKIGPWGGDRGTEFDISGPVPQRLESVTIISGVVINSVAFSYIDPAGKQQTAGPWGGDGELTNTIVLAPAEIVKEVSGTTGTFGGNTVVTSLTIVTNVRTYGPFGRSKGNTFSVPLKDTNVVGFFVRAWTLIDALGVYARPSLPN